MNVLFEHKFADLYDIASGITTTPAQAGHGDPFVSFRTVFNNYFLPEELPDLMDTSSQEQETYSIRAGDILLTRTSETIGELAMSCVSLKDYPRATFSGFVKRLRPNSKAAKVIYSKYLAFYLRGYIFRNTITNHSILTLRASFNESIFNQLKLYLPEYSQQKVIGDFLYSLDRKIALNNRICAELEQAARTVYEYMFLQGERDGWKREKLNANSLCSLISTGIDRFSGKKVYLSTSEVSGEEITNHTITVDYEARPLRANMQPQMHSVWFAKMKNTVKHLLVNESNANLTTDYLLSTGFAGLKCKPNTLYYIWNYLCGEYFERQKDTLATGATQQAINDTDLASFSILVPPQEELNKFTSIVKPHYLLINKLKHDNFALAEHRDFLLPLLMNGQVKVAHTGD